MEPPGDDADFDEYEEDGDRLIFVLPCCLLWASLFSRTLEPLMVLPFTSKSFILLHEFSASKWKMKTGGDLLECSSE